jgi:CRP/FNR family transcriptional regulator, cyclic AMP receptor protein
LQREAGLEILATKGWLNVAPEPFRRALLQLARWRKFDSGALITLGGEETDDLIGVASGCIALTSTLGPPGTPVMHMVQGVFWLGYGPLLRGGERNTTVVARTDVWAASFPATRIRTMLSSGELDWRPLLALSVSYGDITARIAADLLIRKSSVRCIAVILRFAGLRGVGTMPAEQVILPITQSELASACNLSRNVVGDLLRDLAAKGMIAVGYRDITILDPGGLRAMVAEGGEE